MASLCPVGGTQENPGYGNISTISFIITGGSHGEGRPGEAGSIEYFAHNVPGLLALLLMSIHKWMDECWVTLTVAS